MSTTRLYYTDSYRTSFDARIVDVADDGRRVYLDQTMFYPTSGGQPHDLGTLGGATIADVIDEGERIAHVVETPFTMAAERIAGEIHWPRRFDHMQQHTGQHLLSAILEEAYGYHTVSVHFGSEYSSLDLDVDSVNADRIVEVERRANLIAAENRPVTVRFEEASAATGLRKETQREGTLRIVSIEGLDRSACGGTHVRATGEIGALLIRKVERVRKSARLEFVCGLRAVRRARADFEALTRIAGSLSASLDDAAALVGAQNEQLRAAENERRRLDRELAGFRARALYDGAAADARGRRVVRHDGTSMDELRNLAQAMVALPHAVLAGTLADPPSLLFAASEDTGIDAGRTLREAVTKLGGRGGGSPRIAQGSVPDASRIAEAVASVMLAVE
ncbi:MAG TPA: DHHA1 domain-containing protein [Gemmatimonadaceae bacterium]|nr:DHHA1 domain-containing protein [Gemmatimonadaceae bacterium]